MAGPEVRGWDAIAIHPDDDVAVALRDLAAAESIRIRMEETVQSAVVAEAIPLGHKLALRALPRGTPIHKYGECIGVAIADITAGTHVHIHNLASQRARRTT